MLSIKLDIKINVLLTSAIGGYCFHPFLFVTCQNLRFDKYIGRLVCLLLTKSKDFVSILITSGLCLLLGKKKIFF